MTSCCDWFGVDFNITRGIARSGGLNVHQPMAVRHGGVDHFVVDNGVVADPIDGLPAIIAVAAFLAIIIVELEGAIIDIAGRRSKSGLHAAFFPNA